MVLEQASNAAPAAGLRNAKIILGSSSKIRQAVLKEMGYQFDVMSADIDERAIRRDTPEELVMALAQAKAQAILPKIKDVVLGPSQLVILVTADQVVVNGSVIREKPLDEEEARLFISGYEHAPAITVSAVLATNVTTGFSKGCVDKAEIYFHPIPQQVIDDLIKEGTVLYSAGALLVEHPLVSPFVKSMVGSLDSVLGLPKNITESLIQEAITN